MAQYTAFTVGSVTGTGRALTNENLCQLSQLPQQVED